jgi:hypothetical protein
MGCIKSKSQEQILANYNVKLEKLEYRISHWEKLVFRTYEPDNTVDYVISSSLGYYSNMLQPLYQKRNRINAKVSKILNENQRKYQEEIEKKKEVEKEC